jgi:hypothetical protein
MWIIYLLASGSCWGLSDTLCDIVIGHSDKKTYVPKGVIDYEMLAIKKEEDEEHDKPVKSSKKDTTVLTANQTICLSAITAYVLIMIYFLWLIFNRDTYIPQVGLNSFLFKEQYEYTFYLALCSGIFCYFAYHFMIQAFESSSSTVILPLLQFPSVITLLASYIPKRMLGEVWLESYWHLFAYGFIFIGGLLPATNGKPRQLLTCAFWKQPFVQFAIISELNHGLYNLLISSVDAHNFEGEVSSSVRFYLQLEYFALTRLFYIAAFVVYLFGDRNMVKDLINIQYVAKTAIFWTVISELLAFVGYFCSALAYQAYYQTGLVAAAETSLNQLLNLTFAYILKKYFDHGKSESTSGVPVKILSAGLIMMGLYIAGGGGH